MEAAAVSLEVIPLKVWSDDTQSKGIISLRILRVSRVIKRRAEEGVSMGNGRGGEYVFVYT